MFAAILSISSFYWYFIEPIRTIYIYWFQLPYFIIFLSFAALISWFATTRRRVEENLGELAALLDLTQDTVLVMNMEGAITYWNRGAAERYGWTEDQALGRVVHDLLKTTFPARLEEIKEEVARTGHWEGELVHTKKDRTQLVVASRWALQRDARGAPVAILETNTDISERKRAEEALRLAGACNRSLIEASLDPLVTIDPEGRISDVNGATERVTGCTREELVGTDFSDYFTEPEKARAGYQQAFDQGFIRDYELEIRNRNGEITPIIYNASVYRDDTGKVIGVFAAARDITERKLAQEALQNLLNDLEVRVKERTKELSEANEALQTANKELESFSYSVSHDLRAPLLTIDGFSQMVLKGYGDKLDDEGRRKLNLVCSGTKQMGQLIDDLLTFSRLSRKEIVNAKVDMDALVRSAWKELTLLNRERRIQLSIKKLPHAMGDQALIKEVVVNLLSNAIKFTKFRETAMVEVGAYPEEERNVYFVKDNGVGFDMQYYDKLFGVFQRLHHVDEFEGTGVGLAIVQRIIRRHGGRVWADGKSG